MSFKNIDLSNVYCNNNNIFNIAQGGFNNSIFGCMFGSPFGYYTPFNGNCKSAFGFQLGSVLGSIGLMAANCFINRKIEEKQANSPETKLGDLDAEIKTELEKLGENVTEANYKNHKAKDETSFVNRQNDITTNITNYTTQIKNLRSDSNYLDDASIAALEQERDGLDLTNPETKEANKTKYNELNAKIKAAKEINEKIADYEKKLEKANEDQEELNKEIEARQKEIDKVIKKLDELISKKEAIQKAIVMDEADGNAFNRKDITKLVEIGDNGEIHFKDKKDASKVKASHIYDLLKHYNNSTTKADKEKYGKAFITLFTDTKGVELSEGDKKTFNGALKVIKNDLNIA